MTSALCPGSFDPPTYGHIDVVERSLEIFDRVVVAVVANPSKEPMFSADERMGMIVEAFGDRVEVDSFDGLLVDFARSVDVDVWWPASNTRQRFSNVGRNQFIEITEFADNYRPLQRPPLPLRASNVDTTTRPR